jgi:hypothetical protein
MSALPDPATDIMTEIFEIDCEQSRGAFSMSVENSREHVGRTLNFPVVVDWFEEVTRSGHKGVRVHWRRYDAEPSPQGREMAEPVRRLEAATRGECPSCGARVAGWKPMFGAFAPEWWESQRERGIDPATGHRADCAGRAAA